MSPPALVLACRPGDPLVAAFATQLDRHGLVTEQIDDRDASGLLASASSGRQLIIGGFSRGARLAAEIANEVQPLGLLLLGYPFHPTGRPQERAAQATLAQVSARSLVLQGERDAHGNRQAIGAVSPRVRVHWVTDGNHRWRPRVRSRVDASALIAEAADQAAAFIHALAAAPRSAPSDAPAA